MLTRIQLDQASWNNEAKDYKPIGEQGALLALHLNSMYRDAPTALIELKKLETKHGWAKATELMADRPGVLGTLRVPDQDAKIMAMEIGAGVSDSFAIERADQKAKTFVRSTARLFTPSQSAKAVKFLNGIGDELNQAALNSNAPAVGRVVNLER